MSMLYNQRKKLQLHKDALFFGYGKRNCKLKAITYILFSSFHNVKFEQQRLLRECIETYLLKTRYALLHRKSLFVQVPNKIEIDIF